LISAIPPDDPAIALWQRCSMEDLIKIEALLSTPPIPVGEIASKLGIKVISKTLDSDISGLIRFNDGIFIIEVNNTDAGVRQRFTVGHELGHYFLHRDLIDAEGIKDTILYRSKLSNRQESEANRFAAAILLPWTSVNTWHMTAYGSPPAPDHLEAIASQFKTSRLAVGFRFGF
jgi:Zn-dependent peptidase ImmA (M78 family)